MWGQDRTESLPKLKRRIIPTRVGTSSQNGLAFDAFTDHPHACGDKGSLLKNCPAIRGSSPRVWGQVFADRCNAVNKGIIPTRVGTSNCDFVAVCIYQDHPHACGDKLLRYHSNVRTEGSSPRVWGQVLLTVKNSFPYRIIPTRVGTRATPFDTDACVVNHPHACGDKSMPLNQSFITTGSSPRVWGQVSDFSCAPFTDGIIPTRVGTS